MDFDEVESGFGRPARAIGIVADDFFHLRGRQYLHLRLLLGVEDRLGVDPYP